MKSNISKLTKLIPLGWIAAAAISTGCAWQLLKDRPPIPLISCQSRVTINLEKNGSSVRFKTNSRYIIYDDMSGVKSDIGTMQVGAKTYLVNRNYHFRYRNIQHSVEITFTDIIKKPSDNAPDNKALLIPNEQIAYHFTLANLSNGTYLMKLIDVPYVLCAPH